MVRSVTKTKNYVVCYSKCGHRIENRVRLQIYAYYTSLFNNATKESPIGPPKTSETDCEYIIICGFHFLDYQEEIQRINLHYKQGSLFRKFNRGFEKSRQKYKTFMLHCAKRVLRVKPWRDN